MLRSSLDNSSERAAPSSPVGVDRDVRRVGLEGSVVRVELAHLVRRSIVCYQAECMDPTVRRTLIVTGTAINVEALRVDFASLRRRTRTVFMLQTHQ